MHGIQEVDVGIIGAGTAGMAAYRGALSRTSSVLLIEGEHYGTTCARVGCMPSKLLIAAAEAAHAVEGAWRFGAHTPGAAVVDGHAVMHRVRAERDRFVGFVLDTVNGFAPENRLWGRARFVDPNTLEVRDDLGQTQRVRARAFVIATGSRPQILPMFEGLGDRLVVNDDVFSWEALPRSVAVFGAGIVGLELGQALHRLGVRVRIFGVRKNVGPLTDPVVRDEARDVFAAELPLDVESRVLSLQRGDDGVHIRFMEGDDELEEHFQYVLSATGRVTNTDGLGLEHTGISLDKRGVPLFDRRTMQCGDSAIFIAGDANADVPLLHEASDEGRIAGENAGSWPSVSPGKRRSVLAVVFTDPQIAQIGQTWAEIKDQDPVIGRVSFDDQGRSRVMLVNKGRLHLYADRQTGRLLGAEMVGPRAEHLAHLLAWAHQQGLTVADMLAMPFYHPVIEEGLRTALRDAATRLS